jgi:hypothetical protein
MSAGKDIQSHVMLYFMTKPTGTSTSVLYSSWGTGCSLCVLSRTKWLVRSIFVRIVMLKFSYPQPISFPAARTSIQYCLLKQKLNFWAFWFSQLWAWKWLSSGMVGFGRRFGGTAYTIGVIMMATVSTSEKSIYPRRQSYYLFICSLFYDAFSVTKTI